MLNFACFGGRLKPSLLFTTDAPRIAGSEIWLAEVLPRLAGYGARVTLALPSTPSLDPLIPRFKDVVQIIRYKNPNELQSLARSVDLRIMQAWFPASYRMLLTWPRPRWVFTHDQLVYHYPLGIKKLYEQIFHITKARAMRLADGVLTCSRWGARYLETAHGLTAIGIPNGVDTHKFRPPEGEEREKLRRKFGFQKFTWIMPARYSMEKNHPVALLAARLVPSADFVFVGDGPMRHVLAHLARSLRIQNVRVLNFVEDIPALYRASDGLFLPSLAENQSLTTLEAMASGLPTVTSNIPAQQELIEHGHEGFTLPPRPSSLAAGLRQLTSRPEQARSMGLAARRKVMTEHDIDRTSLELFRVLIRLARS